MTTNAPSAADVRVSDVQELGWFFSTPAPVDAGGEPLAAQSYDPKGSTYDPFRDERLARLVLGSRRRSTEWHRIKRVLDELSAPFVAVLRLAFAPLSSYSLPTTRFRWPEVAQTTPAAIARGRHLATVATHTALLEAAYADAVRRGCSGPTTAMRVLESDRLIAKSGVRLDPSDVQSWAKRALERDDDTVLVETVVAEMTELVHRAVEAYRTMRHELGATRRAERAAAGRELDAALGIRRRVRRPRPELQQVCDLVAEALGLPRAS